MYMDIELVPGHNSLEEQPNLEIEFEEIGSDKHDYLAIEYSFCGGIKRFPSYGNLKSNLPSSADNLIKAFVCLRLLQGIDKNIPVMEERFSPLDPNLKEKLADSGFKKAYSTFLKMRYGKCLNNALHAIEPNEFKRNKMIWELSSAKLSDATSFVKFAYIIKSVFSEYLQGSGFYSIEQP